MKQPFYASLRAAAVGCGRAASTRRVGLFAAVRSALALPRSPVRSAAGQTVRPLHCTK